MAVYQFSALSDGQAITFNPNADVLNFDQTSIAAADVRALAEGSNLRMSALGKDVVLLNVTALQLATTNITFADGSRLLFGDNSVAGNDNASNSLTGTGGRDHLWGLGGNDTLNGGAGDDWLVGGAGQDNLTGGTGADSFVFVDTPFNTNYDRVFGFASGSDRVLLHKGAFAEVGALGEFSAGDPRFHAAPGAAGGHDADDRIIYNTSNGNLFYDADGSGSGREMFIGVLHGAPQLAATDITLFDDTAAPPPDPEPGTATNGDDTLVGTAGNDTIDGLAGNDSISGLGGDDSLIGGAGADTLDGGPGDDTFVVDASDVLIDAGGIDTVMSAVSWTLGDAFENLTLTGSGAINAIGNHLANRLVGNDAANGFSGRAGDDTLIGNGGNDTFVMSTGGMPSYGNDSIDGGAGFDTVDFGVNGLSAITADLGAGTMSGGGEAGAGSATLVSIENFNGGAFADHLTGSSAESFLFGYDGDDTLIGVGGNDRLEGGAGNDVLSGGLRLTGGAGADRFVLGGHFITDFSSGVDKLRLDGERFDNVGASGNFAPGDERFYVAAGATAAHDATDRLIYNTSNGDLFYDQDGTGPALGISIATLEGAPVLMATDIEVVNGTSGGSVIIGTAGDDSLVGGEGDDTIHGLGGNDTMEGHGGNDRLEGGSGNDSLIGNEGADVLLGGEGNDTLDAVSGVDRYFADFRLEPESPADTLDGGLGDDVYLVQRTDAVSDPGGVDTIVTDSLEYTLPAGFENLTYDPFIFSDGEGYLIAYSGNGLDNHIVIDGLWHSSTSTLDGGDGDDTLEGSGRAIFQFSLGSGDYGHDELRADGAFTGTIDFADARSGIVANLAAGTLAGGGTGGTGSATFVGIDNVIGGDFADHLVAHPTGHDHFDNAFLRGGGGDDTLEGAQGNLYYLYGDDGADRLVAHSGIDLMTGGAGADDFVLSLPSPGEGALIFDFASGVDEVVLDASGMPALGPSGQFAPNDARFYAAPGATAGQDADDRVVYNISTSELFYDADGSGAGAARLIATLQAGATLVATDIAVENGGAPPPGGQTITGTAGNDSLAGGAGNDTIIGLGGADTLNGAAGDDWLEGGPGHDNLTGGDGADSFVFRDTPFNNNYDRVFGFASGTDELVFDRGAYTNIGALGDFAAGDGRFYAAAGAVRGHDTDDRIIYNTSNGTLYYDADGSGSGREMYIGVLHGAPGLDATDIAII